MFSPLILLSLLQAPAVLEAVRSPAPVEAPWVQLFDGVSLEGWVTRGGRYDGDALWSVEDGVLVGREGPQGEGGLLYTARPYTSFELELETRIDYPFDSGVFLRMAPEGRGAQVTLDHRPGGQIGAIYSDGFLHENLEGERLYRRGEWNHVRVLCTGFDMRIEAWLNGEPLVQYEVPRSSTGFAPTGLVGLQVHGGGGEAGSKSVRFRGIRIRELPIFGAGLFQRDSEGVTRPSTAAADAGWRPLFDGSSISAWSDQEGAECFRVQDGELHFLKRGLGGDLVSRAEFRDYRLRLDFQTSAMANSGVFLRGVRGGGDPATSGCEVQILDDLNWERITGTRLAPYQFCGSLYGAVPAGDHGALRPPGTWNTYELLYQGSRLAVALNGRTLYDVDTFELQASPPFRERATGGFIGLQRYSSEHVTDGVVIRFRDIFVQEL